MAARSGVSIHTTIYNTFRGADFTTDPAYVDRARSPYCTNMISDAGGMPEKRVGWRKLYQLPGRPRINGLYCGVFDGEAKYLAHAGTKFYGWSDGDEEPELLYSGANNDRSQGVPMCGKIWIVTGGDYLCWDGETVQDVCSDGVAYAPKTVISRDPAGGGEPHEDINLLGRYRVNSFLADGSSKIYHVDSGEIDEEGDITVTVNGTVMYSGWSANRSAGTITFTTAPAAPEEGAEDNVTIKFPCTVDGYADRIRKCRIVTQYGLNETNRIFLSGNPDYPNLDWYCGLLDPTYVTDLSYSNVGLEGVAIRGYCRLGAYLAIVKEQHPQDSSVFLRSGKLDDNNEPVFPIQSALTGVGAINTSSFATLLEEPLFLSGTGIYAMATSTYTSERLAQNRSYYLNGALLREDDLSEAAAVQWQGMYLLSIGNGHVYVLDARQPKSYRSAGQSDYCYEGYFWANIPARCWMTRNDGATEHLFFGTEDGRICRMNNDQEGMRRFRDDEQAVKAVWATKVDDDGDATVQKTMIKRGAAVTIKPHTHTSAKIYVAKDEEADKLIAQGSMSIFDFEDIDFTNFTFETYDGPKDIMLHTKVKKYKRLQILVINQEPAQGFGVYAITKHFVTGNYAKK